MPAVQSDVYKRRAPYTPRACDACRRRKGRCDGRRPCRYCLGRSTDCCYSRNPLEDGSTGGEQPSKKPRDEASMPTKWTPAAVQSLTGMVDTMQRQSDAIVAHVRAYSGTSQGSHSPGGPVIDPAIFAQAQVVSRVSTYTVLPSSGERLLVSTKPEVASKRVQQRFYGPTSPDYCLNAAQQRVRRGMAGEEGPGEQSMPSFNDAKSEGEEDWAEDVDSLAMSRQPPRQAPRAALLQFLGLFTRHEAVRLLKVYHQAIGELHPVCDIEQLLEQMEWLYDRMAGTRDDDDGGTAVDENALLILNLALSIALCAEAASKSSSADMLYNCYRDIVNAHLSAPATSVRHVTIAILEGFYHFYRCSPCLAWRIIGVAGRMAMELGLHNVEVCRRAFATNQQRTEVAVISCSLLIMDRQLSAATGLRPNFQFSDFDMAQVTLAPTPYLKAMMVFTLMGDNFNGPITRAARGNTEVDDDCLEVTAFQVKQWRKRALHRHNFTHPSTWDSSTQQPASWTLVLYLRANAVLAILLRSFFLASPAKTDVDKIKQGLEVVSDSISVLSVLNKTTNVYRVQHPHLQHFLASSCALLFLIVANTAHRNATLLSGFPEDYTETVKENFEAALELSAAYKSSFRQSHKLWRRIMDLEEPLARLGILPRDNKNMEKTVSDELVAPISVAEEPDRTQESVVKPFVIEPLVDPVNSATDNWGDFGLHYDMQHGKVDPAGALPAAAGIVGDESALEVVDPLLLDWPMYTPQRFFSGILF